MERSELTCLHEVGKPYVNIHVNINIIKRAVLTVYPLSSHCFVRFCSFCPFCLNKVVTVSSQSSSCYLTLTSS